ncbi:MAG TPA: phosphatase PAP2 family protein [Ramlibacter sp.]|uniref:phosphatase PAP2 family protein n=1 Tax=Ramlibacter sp. TaxID=1917967 RepID=UPI002C6B2A63|nr:phosphatase PAP2 family protein [Ramlibacter sp.]HVZ46783.1 phosphatase PAP2 family protein [Ramlibacter sp.]
MHFPSTGSAGSLSPAATREGRRASGARALDTLDLRIPLAAAMGLLALGIVLLETGGNRALILWMHAGPDSEWRHVVWSSLTVLGFGWATLIVCMALDRASGRLVAMLPALLILSAVVTHGGKYVVASARPAGTDIASQLHVIGMKLAGSYSMPSGHSLAAGALAMFLCLWMPQAWVRRWGALVVVVAVLASVSRVAVGAHWPADAACGFALGMLCVLLLAWLVRKRPVRKLYLAFAARIHLPAGQWILAGIEVIAGVSFLASNIGYPQGRGMLYAVAALAWMSAAARVRRVLRRGRVHG